MDEELLESIGLTRRERKTYVALCEIGTTTVGSIIKKSMIPSSKIYETLDKLSSKGLVSFQIRNNRKYFQAADPRILLDFLEEKKIRLQNEVIPELELKHKFAQNTAESTVYESASGIKTIYEKSLELMKKGDTLYVLSSPSSSNELLGSYLDYYHKRRIKKGIKMKILYNKEAKKYGEDRKNMKLTQVRYLPEEQVVLSAINMFLDYSLIFDYNKPAKCIMIKSRNVTHNFITYFNMLWKISKRNA